MNESYTYLLQDKRWQKKRLEIFQRDGWRCAKCDDPFTRSLHIHHLYYNFDLMPWEYPDSALITLCDLCHLKAHFMQWVIKTGILNLKAEGFQADDIHDVQNLVFRNLSKNGHKESAERYINDIKLLMNG